MVERGFVTLGTLIDSGQVEAVTGFPFGDHRQCHAGVAQMRPYNVKISGRIDLSQIKYVPKDASDGRPQLRDNDILFNNTNTKELVGKCALWTIARPFVFSNHMTRIRVQCDNLDPGYLTLQCCIIGHAADLECLQEHDVAQASLIGQRFREIRIPAVDYEDQRSIARALTTVQRSVELEEQSRLWRLP